jgi:hypothetical protein
MIRLAETWMSRGARGAFLGRTARRGLGLDSFFDGEPGRVGVRVLKDTRLVLPFRLWQAGCFGGLFSVHPLLPVVVPIGVAPIA